LAIRLVGATLIARPRQSLASFVPELRERVDELSIADDPRTVAAALAHTYTGLAAATARLFAQLGLLPGTTVCLQLAAAAAGVSQLRARRLLDELIAANLVIESGQDRYRMHDMVRRYARRCGAGLPDRTMVEQRVIRWYLAVLTALAVQCEPEQDRPSVISRPEWSPLAVDGTTVEPFIEAEAPDLPAVVRWAQARDDHELTWRLISLAQAAGAPLPIEICELGLMSAVQLDDRFAVGEAHARLGTALLRDPHRLEDADGHLRLAVTLLEPADGRLLSLASFALAALRSRQQRPAEAAASLDSALRFLDPGREPLAFSVALLAYARVLVRRGSVDRGHERFAQAVILREAIAGGENDPFGRFDRGRSHLDDRLFEEYLARLHGSLDAPRVSVPDHTLAATFIDIIRALRLPDVLGPPTTTAVSVSLPRQRMCRTEQPQIALPLMTMAEPY
jgi:hypothetical protein